MKNNISVEAVDISRDVYLLGKASFLYYPYSHIYYN